MKRIIISADDFGYSEENNIAVSEGYKSEVLTSAGLMANMPGFYNAVNEVLPQINGIDLGFHFNIVEGKSLTNADMLCNSQGYFNRSFADFLLNQNNKKLLVQIEDEFRAQIEKILEKSSISHVDSHVHIHAVPGIFKLVVKLAKEYNIKYVRTQREIPYCVLEKIFDKRFPANVIKNVLLNILSVSNAGRISELKTNDYIIGVLYTGYMDENAIYEGLKQIKNDNSTVEVLFHPYLPPNLSNCARLNNYREFLITKTPKFKENLKNLGFELSSFRL